MMNDGGMMNWMMNWMMLPWLIGLLLIVIVVAGAVLAIIWTTRRMSSGPAATETPLEILKRRLALGEITPEQFDTMKRQLDPK